jgi:hypothetical protein
MRKCLFDFNLGYCAVEEKLKKRESSVELCMIGAELQLRGVKAISQPLISPSGNILIFNGNFNYVFKTIFFTSYKFQHIL